MHAHIKENIKEKKQNWELKISGNRREETKNFVWWFHCFLLKHVLTETYTFRVNKFTWYCILAIKNETKKPPPLFLSFSCSIDSVSIKINTEFTVKVSLESHPNSYSRDTFFTSTPICVRISCFLFFSASGWNKISPVFWFHAGTYSEFSHTLYTVHNNWFLFFAQAKKRKEKKDNLFLTREPVRRRELLRRGHRTQISIRTSVAKRKK